MGQQPKMPESMPDRVGYAITAGTILLPAVAFALVGLLAGNEYTAASFVILWCAVYFVAVLRFRRRRTFLVVERFGYLWRVMFAGPQILVPFIDNVVFEGDFLQKSVRLFRGESNEPVEVDFSDSSTPINAVAWYQIGDPADVGAGNHEALREQVLRYVYSMRAEASDARIAGVYEGELQPLFEKHPLAKAQEKRPAIAQEAVDNAKPALAEIGIYSVVNKGIIVSDIELPDAVIELRERELRGQADAKEATNRSRGYWQPLVDMKKGLQEAGMQLDDQQIVGAFNTQRSLEAIQKTGANISLIAPDMHGVLKAIEVGSAGPKPKTQPKGST